MPHNVLMPNFIDLTNKIFVRWTVLSRAENCRHGGAQFLCLCLCGNKKVVPAKSLRDGSSGSCGCLNLEIRSRICIERNATHNMTGTKIYRAWINMIQRCTNPKVPGYKHYGAKGITVCDSWSSFESFYADMGDLPSHEYTIDRVDNKKGYSSSNCRWATMKEQQNNRSNNHLITLNSETKTLMQWSDSTGFDRKTISTRIKRGWSIKRALTETPKKGRNQYG